MIKPTRQGQKGITTVGFAGSTILAGVKPGHQIKRDTKNEPTTRRD